jgi:hypothetical protein
MKTMLLAAAAAAATLVGGAAMAQPYGYAHSYDRGGYGYGGYDRGYDNNHRGAYRLADRDRDGIPDRWDRYDNRRDRWDRRHYHHRHDWRYDRYERW